MLSTYTSTKEKHVTTAYLANAARPAKFVLPLVAAAVLAAACSSSGSGSSSGGSGDGGSKSTPAANGSGQVTIKTTKGSAGQFLTDGSGRALYLFRADPKDASNCSGSCVTY